MTKSVLCRTNLGLDLFQVFQEDTATIFVRGGALCVEIPRKGDIPWVNDQLKKYGWVWSEHESMWYICLGQGVP